MSRKARENSSTWEMPSLYAFVGAYGPFKIKGHEPIKNTLIWVCNSQSENIHANDGQHDMCPLAGAIQQELLLEANDKKRFKTVLVMDVKDIFGNRQNYEDALSAEIEEVILTKKFGKKLLRLFQRLLLQDAIVAASGKFCAVLLKLYQAAHRIDASMISELWLFHPELSTKYVNTHFVTQNHSQRQHTFPVQLNVVHKLPSSRVSVLAHFFPVIGVIIEADSDINNCFSIIADHKDSKTLPPSYRPDLFDAEGKTLFMSSIKVEMNRYTKQYERICDNITEDLMPFVETLSKEGSNASESAIDFSSCERHVGALILRGNRCVLVRSLSQEWKGMMIPSVLPEPGETPGMTAIRAAVEFTEVDATEMKVLPNVLPVAIYAPNDSPIFVELHPLYATEPPPDGPLEDADIEDDESPYDWYTFPNAVAKLDKPSNAALRIMALNLIQAANVGLVPTKWGGVFGQELKLLDTSKTSLGVDIDEQSLLEAKVEEWAPSRQGDLLQDVRSAVTKRLGNQRDDDRKRSAKLPVTLLSGFLGSGKTTLLSHVLANYQDLKVAILVNDMGEINIDAALIRSAVSIRQREEHMVELSNGCICCTLREDLLVEVANIAADSSFDYLLIESTGVSEPMPVAETFTFEDSNGLCLGDVAEIDTLVTVVDGSRFIGEMESLESLQCRNWQTDPEDQRTISHLLCDQVEFANVIVLNKCDLMKNDEKMKVKTLIKKMNPDARLVEAEFSNVPLDLVLGTGLFSMSDAEKHQRWLQEARIGEHRPETEEYGIKSFTYRATRPFLPHKLYAVLWDTVKKSQAPFDSSNVLRAKGFIWLANYPELQGQFSLAGNHFSLLPGNPWWAEIDKSHWPDNLESNIAPLWHEPYGDRQQEIVFIGQSLNEDAICEVLNECLVSEESMEAGQLVWDAMVNDSGDPFRETWNDAIAISSAEETKHNHSDNHVGCHDHDHNH
eukprot:CCRYP_014210-RA/>CCRYP_014210-RA protein AED:0.01 eAED:0.01 QI:37/1/1/1/1/1/2/89/956